MTTRLAVRIAWLTLAGVVMGFGLGGGNHPPATRPTNLTVAAAVKSTVQGLGKLMAPATAEAAVSKKAPKKKKARLTSKSVKATKPHKTVAKQKSSAPQKTAAKQRSSTPHKLIATKQKRGRACAVKKGVAKIITARRGKTRAKATMATVAKGTFRKRSVGGRCEPQSLTYARDRSGIMRSRSGHENGPLTWFASEKRLGKTSDQPAPGSVLILGADRGHGMSTGHVAYVEEASPSGASRYKLTFSHTNYDRKCSLETNIEAIYNSSAKTLDIYSGAWQPWGRGLKVAGFIQQE